MKNRKTDEEIHTFLNCNLSKFQNDQNFKISECSDQEIYSSRRNFFQFPDFCVPDISKTDKVINLKQTPKVA